MRIPSPEGGAAMLGWLIWSQQWHWRPRVEECQLLGLPLTMVTLPAGDRRRRLAQGGRVLRRLGIRRAIADQMFDGWRELASYGIAPVDPLPICRSKGGELALALLEKYPLKRRIVALCGEVADRTAWALADCLCPQTGTLLLDFGRGGDALAGHLRRAYGAASPGPGHGLRPQVTVELSPRTAGTGEVLRLWGRPDLAGLELEWRKAPRPEGVDPLMLLELLWETGRAEGKDIVVACRRNVLDRGAENTYNTG